MDFSRRIIIGFALFALANSTAWAQGEKPGPQSSEAEAALDFAQRHHPELAQLIKRLRSADQPAFRKAIDDLSRTRQRLTRLKERDPERYELALRVWSLDSRIRLLVARSTMNDDAKLEPRLRHLLKERQQARLKLLQMEQERLRSRLEQVNKQISRIEGNPEKSIEDDLARIQRNINSAQRRGGKLGSDKPNRPSRQNRSDAKQSDQ